MKTLILTSGNKGTFFLRTKETATQNERDAAEFLGIRIVSQRDRGIDDGIIGQKYKSAVDAVDAVFTLTAKVQIVSSQKLAKLAAAKAEAES